MPLDGGTKVKIKGSKRSGRFIAMSGSAGKEDWEGESNIPANVRLRLNKLFAEIEKEFEGVCAENVALLEKVESLQDQLEAYTAGEKPVEPYTPGEKTVTDTLDIPDGATKQKRSASHISQKIKTTYKAGTSKIVSSFRQTTQAYSAVRSYHGHKDGVWEVKISAFDPHLIGTASADHSARIWNIESGKCVLQYLGHQGSVNSIRFNRTQDVVVTASGDQTAHIWCPKVMLPSHDSVQSSGEDDLDNSEKEASADEMGDQHEKAVLKTPSRELIGHQNVVVAADWLLSGDRVVTASWDRSAFLYDAETGTKMTALLGHDQELTDVRAHPSQTLVMTSSKDTTFRLWDYREPNMQVTVFQGHSQPVTSAVFVKHEKIVSGSDDRTVKIWDLKNMRSPIATIRTDAPVNRLSVSPNQCIIAIPLDNRHIRLFDLNGNRVGRLPRNNTIGHGKMVSSVAWADENALCNLFSCGFDRHVFGWHINLPAAKDKDKDKE